MYAGTPLTVTLSPSRLVGSWPLAKSEFPQVRVSPAGPRLEPWIATQVFGAMVARPPSAFATSVIFGVGVVRGSGARATGVTAGPKIEEWGSIWPVATLIVAMPAPVAA